MVFNKKVFSGLFVFAVAFFVFGFYSNSAQASGCSAANSTDWATGSTWGAGCSGIGGVPTSADDVTIPGNKIVTVTIAGAQAHSISISDPVATGGNGITIASPGTLAVSTTVTLVGSSGASNSTLAVADGSLSAASISIVGGSTGNSVVSVSSGTISTTGSITPSGAATRAQLTSTGASLISIGGNLASGGTLTTSGTGTINFNGGSAQTIGTYTTFNNVNIANTSGGVTLTGTTTVGGNLSVSSPGIFDVGGQVFTVTGTTIIGSGDTLAFSSATNPAKTFTGDVSIQSGGTWNETAAVTPTFAGNLSNSGTFTASTGVHTLSGATKVISGIISIPSLAVTGTVTNNGTLTIATALSGSGTLTNGGQAVLNIGDVASIVGLTASASGNSVNYTKTGAQTVFPTAYYNITLSGSGAKTVTGVTASNAYTVVMGSHNYTVASGSTATSITINPSTLAVLVPSGTFTLRSSNGFLLPNADGGAVVAPQVCNPMNFFNSVVIAGTGSTFTITPDTTQACFVTGGGGGQLNMAGSTTTTTTTTSPIVTTTVTTTPSTTPVVIPVVVTPVAPVVIGGCNGSVGFSTVSGMSCAMNTSMNTPTTTTFPVTWYDFGTTTLKLGSTGNGVKQLQMFLNAKLNLGLVLDGKLGPKTIAVIKQWQKNHGLVADGLIGAKTKAQMNASVQ